MFEIDENTRYSLRILGRVSVILVSVALVLAIIGYFHRDGNNNQDKKLPDIILAQQFIQIAESPQMKDLNDQRISIKGTVDSINRTMQNTTAYISAGSEKVLEFKLNEDVDNLELGQQVIVSGKYKGKLNETFQFENCTLKEQ